MIKIVIDGIQFEMECTTNQDTRCDNCKAGDLCRTGNRIGHWCGRAEYDNMLICTSATPVKEEAKVYGPHNRGDAIKLIGMDVEFFYGWGWCKGKLYDVSGYHTDIAYIIEDGKYGTIREIKPRRLTQSQIIEAHPDLEGVELVGGWV